VFEALMPLSKEVLLKIVRENAEEVNDVHKYELWMVDATLAIVLGGAQFKEETDLWAAKTLGLMPPPDFGRHLSRDKFKRIIRYWSRGLKAERDQLR
jgi:hypothetical protein